ncbi:protein of unknown function [Agreia sp. COWG]|nr:protein of unknown function [Agreia sp. COWG]
MQHSAPCAAASSTNRRAESRLPTSRPCISVKATITVSISPALTCSARDSNVRFPAVDATACSFVDSAHGAGPSGNARPLEHMLSLFFREREAKSYTVFTFKGCSGLPMSG